MRRGHKVKGKRLSHLQPVLWLAVAVLLLPSMPVSTSPPTVIMTLVTGPIEEAEYAVIQAPTHDMDTALQHLSLLYTGARWTFYSDGVFEFAPATTAPAEHERIYPLVGIFAQTEEGLFFAAILTEYDHGEITQASLQGTITMVGGFYDIALIHSFTTTSGQAIAEAPYGYFRFRLRAVQEGMPTPTPTSTRRSLRPSRRMEATPTPTPTATSTPTPTSTPSPLLITTTMTYRGLVTTTITSQADGAQQTLAAVPVVVYIAPPIQYRKEDEAGLWQVVAQESNPLNLLIRPESAPSGAFSEGGIWLHSAWLYRTVALGDLTQWDVIQPWQLGLRGHELAGQYVGPMFNNGLALRNGTPAENVSQARTVALNHATLSGTVEYLEVNLVIRGATTDTMVSFVSEVMARRAD